ncbi:hypothetical protein FKP32DRAFT_1742248, partial [Trametes sanguinea]
LPPEVLRNICKQLYPTTSQDDGKGGNTLLILARTSRAFHEHALNAIWETIPDYGPLVYTLPGDAWAVGESPPEDKSGRRSPLLSITRRLVPTDLARLKYYAPRVRRILSASVYTRFRSSSLHCRPQPSCSVIEAFANLFDTMPGAFMLPNIGELHLCESAHTEEEKVKLVLSLPVLYGPKLTCFSYKCFPEYIPCGDAMKYALQKLSEISPKVAFFESDSAISLREVTSHTLCSLRNLVSVRSHCPISVEAFLHVARQPSLQKLDVLLQNDDEEEFLATFGSLDGSGYFSQLTILRFHYSGGPGAASVIINAVHSPFLEEVYIAAKDREQRVYSSDVHSILAAIATCRGQASVRELIVSVGSLAAEDAITKETLAPILDLPRLTVVKVHVQGRYAIDNDACRAIAQSWPRLRQLHLASHCTDPSPVATFAGVIYLAQSCPEF